MPYIYFSSCSLPKDVEIDLHFLSTLVWNLFVNALCVGSAKEFKQKTQTFQLRVPATRSFPWFHVRGSVPQYLFN